MSNLRVRIDISYDKYKENKELFEGCDLKSIYDPDDYKIYKQNKEWSALDRVKKMVIGEIKEIESEIRVGKIINTNNG
jgi:hypothetical protein